MNNTTNPISSYSACTSLKPIVSEIQKQSFPENKTVENPENAVTQSRTQEHPQQESSKQTFQKIESLDGRCPSVAPFDLHFEIIESETSQKSDIVASLKWFLEFLEPQNQRRIPIDSKISYLTKLLPKLFDLWQHSDRDIQLLAWKNISSSFSPVNLKRDNLIGNLDSQFFTDLFKRLNAHAQYVDKQLPDEAWIKMDEEVRVHMDKIYGTFPDPSFHLKYDLSFLLTGMSILISHLCTTFTHFKNKPFITNYGLTEPYIPTYYLEQLTKSICLFKERIEKIAGEKSMDAQRLLVNETELKSLIEKCPLNMRF